MNTHTVTHTYKDEQIMKNIRKNCFRVMIFKDGHNGNKGLASFYLGLCFSIYMEEHSNFQLRVPIFDLGI